MKTRLVYASPTYSYYVNPSSCILSEKVLHKQNKQIGTYPIPKESKSRRLIKASEIRRYTVLKNSDCLTLKFVP